MLRPEADLIKFADSIHRVQRTLSTGRYIASRGLRSQAGGDVDLTNSCPLLPSMKQAAELEPGLRPASIHIGGRA